MKSRTLTCITAMTLFAALAITVRLAAQEQHAPQGQTQQNRRYKFVDLGTFGGPNNSFTQNGRLINNQGTVAGGADDTAIHDCQRSFGDCYVGYTFQWQNGVLTDLGALPGGGSSTPNALNAQGWTVGISQNGAIDPVAGSEFVAVLWKDGQIVNLGTLGGNFSYASDINSRGQVAGWALNAIPASFSLGFLCAVGGPLPTEMRASVWQDGMIQNLGTLGGPESCALHTNERGQVTGNSYTNSTPNLSTGVPTVHPFLWENGKMQDLGTLGGTVGSPNGLNNRGQVVGTSNLAGDSTFHPFLWTESEGMQDLGTFGGSNGQATWVNDAGEVVGEADFPGDQVHDAFLWKKGVLADLGNLGKTSFAFFINSKGQIVGHSLTNDGTFHGFLWEKDGPMIDLNIFVPPSANLLLTDALYINNHGEIAGNGVLPNGDQHAFLLLPCGEREEGCVDAPLDPAIVAKSQASGAVPKAMTAEELATVKERMVQMRARIF